MNYSDNDNLDIESNVISIWRGVYENDLIAAFDAASGLADYYDHVPGSREVFQSISELIRDAASFRGVEISGSNQSGLCCLGDLRVGDSGVHQGGGFNVVDDGGDTTSTWYKVKWQGDDKEVPLHYSVKVRKLPKDNQ